MRFENTLWRISPCATMPSRHYSIPINGLRLGNMALYRDIVWLLCLYSLVLWKDGAVSMLGRLCRTRGTTN